MAGKDCIIATEDIEYIVENRRILLCKIQNMD